MWTLVELCGSSNVAGKEEGEGGGDERVEWGREVKGKKRREEEEGVKKRVEWKEKGQREGPHHTRIVGSFLNAPH